MVELKPALGFIFADYIAGYSHWAYADLDLLVGHLSDQVSADYRLYLRGQLTIMKNNPLTIHLWKDCPHLSTIGRRMEQFFDSQLYLMFVGQSFHLLHNFLYLIRGFLYHNHHDLTLN